MKKRFKTFVLLVMTIWCTSATAQVSTYSFSQPTGTYVPITGGTVIATASANTSPGNLSAAVWNLPALSIPFTFMFNGIGYTGLNITSNGFITFGATSPGGAITNPISNTAGYDGCIAAWGRGTHGVFNLGSSPGVTSEIRVETIGTAPTRTFVIQYDNWRYSSSVSTITATAWVLDFQIRLCESTNNVYIVYGQGQMVGGSLTTSGFTSQVGLRGATNTDYNNRTNTTSQLFSNSTAGTANNATQAWAVTSGVGTGTPGMPPTGLTYRWEPGCSISLSSAGPNGTSPILCSGQSLTLTTNAMVNFTWSTGNTTTTSIVVSPTANTTYSVTGTSTSNCMASAAINVLVSSGVPSMSITASPTAVCLGGSAVLTATGANTYTWTGNITNSVTFTPTATQSYTVTGQNGCGTSTSVTTLSVGPLQVTGAGPGTICAGSAATLSVSAAGATQFTWQPLNATTTTSNYNVFPQVNTVYTITASNGTCSGVTNITLTAYPIPTISAIVTPTSICPGESATLTASGGNNYTWSPMSSSLVSVVVSPTASSPYSVVGDNSFGCLGSANAVVLVGQAPTLTINPVNALICAGASTTLTASGANTYQWSGGPPTNIYVVTPGQSSVYSVTGTLTSSGCADTETVSVELFNPVMSINGVAMICSGQTASFTASAPGANPNSFVWMPGNIPFPSLTGVTPTSTTIYTVSAMSSTQSITCPVSGTIQLTVNQNPTITANPTPTSICKKDVATLNAIGAASYVWTIGTTTLGTSSTQTISASSATVFNITVIGTDALGCEDTKVITLYVNACNGFNEFAGGTKLLIYPNPCTGEFTLGSDSPRELTIVNELGQVVKRMQLSQQSGFRTSVSDLAAGVYFVTDGRPDLREKIIVAR
jgi:hypothetical protein